jgi:hypothetical protein
MTDHAQPEQGIARDRMIRPADLPEEILHTVRRAVWKMDLRIRKPLEPSFPDSVYLLSSHV